MLTSEAATRLGLSTRRVRVLVKQGRIAAEKHGRDWWLDAASVEVFAASERKPGRPPR